MAKKKPTWAQQLKAENAELKADAEEYRRSSEALAKRVAELNDANQKHLRQIGDLIVNTKQLRTERSTARAEAEQHRQTALKLAEASLVGAVRRGGRFRRLKDHLTLNDVTV